MSRRTVMALTLLSCGTLWAQQEPAVSGPASAEDPQRRFAAPASQAPTLPQGPVKSRAVAAPGSKSTATKGYEAWRALKTQEGEALVVTAEGQRLLHPGDRLGTDVVKAVDDGLLVLDRAGTPGRAGGDQRIVMRFDAQGRASVRIYTTEDATAVALPKVH